MTDSSDPLNLMSALGQQPVTLLGEVSVEPLAAVGVIEAALTQVKDNLTEFVASETFETDILTVFGESANVDLGETIINALAVGENLSRIIVAPVEQMNGASGGFDSLTGTVYLADSLINGSSLPVADVLTEELGHYIDSQLNKKDAPGDEGALFAALVRGEVLSWEDVGRLRRENDKVRILGGLLEVEASGEVSFSKATNFAVGNRPYSVAVGDFNGDGISDLAVPNSGDNNVSVLLGKGNGSFSKATNFAVGGNNAQSVAVGEFNSDGISDLAVANADSYSVSVLLGKGNGSFSNATNFAVGDGANSVAVEDFNGDGISDLAVANWYDDNVSVLLGNGNGSFSSATNFAVGDGPLSVAVGNFNSDGISDLAVANYWSGNVSVLLGKGNGSFSNATNFAVGNSPWPVAVEDFNGDGISDLAVPNSGDNNVSVLLGKGNGSFSNATNFAVRNSPRSLAVGDFNGDGISDLAVPNFIDDNVSVLLGKGNGSFSKATNFAVGDRPVSVTVGEFNGDGISDLAVTNHYSNNISILLNTTPPPPNLTINNTTTSEGDTNKTAKFQVTLDAPTNQSVTVNYTTANQTAKANQDYKPTNGTLTFSPGETRKTITVPILGDTQIENNETFQLQLSNPTNAILKDKLGIGTITNDDFATLSIKDTQITEGDSGKKQAKFTVALNAKVNERVEVSYATSDGTAQQGSDYQQTQGKLTFKPGQTRKTITVPILGDALDEDNEKFTVQLSKPSKGVKLGDQRAIGTIKDNDAGGDKPGDSFQAAINIGKLTEEEVVVDEIGFTENAIRDTNDFYRFQTGKQGTFVLTLGDLLKDANVDLYGSGEELINQSKNDGTKRESIVTTLDPGVYYVSVYPQGGDRTPYRLSLDLL